MGIIYFFISRTLYNIAFGSLRESCVSVCQSNANEYARSLVRSVALSLSQCVCSIFVMYMAYIFRYIHRYTRSQLLYKGKNRVRLQTFIKEENR